MMSAERDGLTLTRSQAGCLMVLRNPALSQARIAVAAKLDLRKAEAALLRLQELGFVQQNESGLWVVTRDGETCSFATAPEPIVADAGKRSRRLPPPRLPVRSDRVHMVLQTIADAGALRIRDVKNLTNISRNSINALMQYLKRKRLVAKAGDEFEAPYRLTEAGAAILAEMSLRRAA